MSKKLVDKVKENFIKHFQKEPVVVFSPGRINLIGEHTDYNQGYVFPAAIDLGIAVGIQKSKENQSRVLAHDLNEFLVFDTQRALEPIKNGGWKNYVLGVFIELQKKKIKIPAIDMVFGGNVPGGAGLSSSAAIENGVVYAINQLFQLNLSKEEMVFISQRAEQNSVGVNCGIMDQYASMFGEKNQAILLDCEHMISRKISLNLLDYEFLLINSNVKHNLAENEYNDRRMTCEEVAKKLKVTSLRNATIPLLEKMKSELSLGDYEKAIYVLQENERVLNAEKALLNNDLSALGKLLYASHEGLKDLYKVSCDELDFLVEMAKKNPNVLGARMMGGGFGGCTLNLVKTDSVAAYLEEVSENFKNKFKRPSTSIKIKISQGTRTVN
ncbi:MAG: galactokinase [Wenyingzhuangia sp.]|jgi:galactokinase